MHVLQVPSSRDAGLLRVEWDSREWWRVSLRMPRLTATARVDSFASDGENTLALFFRRLSDDWRGWDGERVWASIEGQFDVTATHDGLGHIALRVRLRGGLYDEDWRVEGIIWLDAGALALLARQVAVFEAAQPA